MKKNASRLLTRLNTAIALSAVLVALTLVGQLLPIRPDDSETARRFVLEPDSGGLSLREISGAGSPSSSHAAVPAPFTPFFLQPVPINLADRELLKTLPGIGPAMAEKILLTRSQFGPFQSASDLQKVPGIGEKRRQQLAPLISFRLEQ